MAPLVPCGFEQSTVAACPENNRTLQAGIISVTMMAKSTPVIPGTFASRNATIHKLHYRPGDRQVL
jgi:hypothetical protein